MDRYIYAHIYTHIYIYAYTYIYTHHSPLEQAHGASTLTHYLAVLRVKILTNQIYSNFYIKLAGKLAFEKFDWQCCAQDSLQSQLAYNFVQFATHLYVDFCVQFVSHLHVEFARQFSVYNHYRADF